VAVNKDNPTQNYWGNVDYQWDGTLNAGRWLKYVVPGQSQPVTAGSNPYGLAGIDSVTKGVIDLKGGNNNHTVGYTGSYGMNSWLDSFRYTPNPLVATNFTTMRVFSGIEQASMTPMFCDCVWAETDGSNSTASPGLPANPSGTTNSGIYPGIYPSNGPNGNFDLAGSWTNVSTGRVLLNRHNMAINAAFADGSAREVKLGDIWKVSWYNGWQPTEINLPPQ
jgi:prepilin-type processing-associated H-X9-DG protein